MKKMAPAAVVAGADGSILEGKAMAMRTGGIGRDERGSIIEKNTGDCISCREVVGGFITREVVDGFIGSGVEDIGTGVGEG